MSSRKAKQLGIPLVGGVSLAASMGCGAKQADEDLLGRWNLVSQVALTPGAIETPMPYAFNYAHYGDDCVFFAGTQLEVDSDTHGRWVSVEGYTGCGEMDGVSDSSRDIPITMSDEGLSFDLVIGSSSSPGDGASTGGPDIAVFNCARANGQLVCESQEFEARMTFERSHCSTHSDCASGESCLTDICVEARPQPDGGPEETTG